MPKTVPAEQSAGPGPHHGLDQSAMLGLLGYNLAQASIPTSKAFRKRIAPLGLTQVEFTVLTLLFSNRGVTQRQLGRALGAAPSNLTNLLGRLEGKRLIRRRRGTLDARTQSIALTGAGAALARKASAAAADMEHNVLRTLSDGERRILFELLQKVARLRHG